MLLQRAAEGEQQAAYQGVRGLLHPLMEVTVLEAPFYGYPSK